MQERTHRPDAAWGGPPVPAWSECCQSDVRVLSILGTTAVPHAGRCDKAHDAAHTTGAPQAQGGDNETRTHDPQGLSQHHGISEYVEEPMNRLRQWLAMLSVIAMAPFAGAAAASP